MLVSHRRLAIDRRPAFDRLKAGQRTEPLFQPAPRVRDHAQVKPGDIPLRTAGDQVVVTFSSLVRL